MKLIAVFKVIFVLKNSEIRKKVDFLSFCDICEKTKVSNAKEFRNVQTSITVVENHSNSRILLKLVI